MFQVRKGEIPNQEVEFPLISRKAERELDWKASIKFSGLVVFYQGKNFLFLYLAKKGLGASQLLRINDNQFGEKSRTDVHNILVYGSKDVLKYLMEVKEEKVSSEHITFFKKQKLMVLVNCLREDRDVSL